MLARLDARPTSWLVLGAALVALTQISHAVAPLAWIAVVPWLRWLRLGGMGRRRLGFALALFIGWSLAVLKIASEPRLALLTPIFAAPMALAHCAAYFAWDLLRRRTSPVVASAFVALAIGAGEAILFSVTELGSWGAIGYTQMDDLALVQSASVVGVAGVGVLVTFVGAGVEASLAGDRRPLVVAASLALVAHVLGAARLWAAELSPPELLPVALIGTDADVSGTPLPDRETTHAWDLTLAERTRAAARGGAELVVWTEAATMVFPDDEEAWVSRLSELARSAGVDVVAAYVVPVSDAPFRYRNEVRLALRDGTIEVPYAKRHPVPGEPAIPGEVDAPFYARPWGVLSGAICYDYDFPPMARARRSAGVVAVPASDWRGIDPVHGEMAVVRAIESGHAIVRSTRFGLSIAADAWGHVRASRSSFETGPGVTFALVPHEPVTTPYVVVGDVPLFLALGATLVLGLRRAGQTHA